jgi:hypothetical protein
MRRSKPNELVVEEKPPGRWKTPLLILLFLAVLVAGFWPLISRLNRPPKTLVRSEAAQVRSEVTQEGDSLDVIVAWTLTKAPPQGTADSVRVEVGVGEGTQARVISHSANQLSDTLRVGAPQAGETSQGYSCVATIIRGRLNHDSCTPWQFVRPNAVPDTSRVTRGKKEKPTSSRETIARLEIQPAGLQVDPDVGGRCADWQRRNPERSVWLEVNRRAVAECTGPNNKPTVAQFCAFAVLTNGDRVQTRNSSKIPYCGRLFQEWVRERIS